METTEQTKRHGGIYNYFQGATINNLVINGNMTKSAPDHFHNASSKSQNSVSGEQVVKALSLCKAYIWGNAAYSVIFCVCRDIYHMENNTSSFERMLNDCGIELPLGTINNAMSRNPWMKYHIDRWEENGVKERVLKLRDEFRTKIGALETSSIDNV